MSRHFSPSHVQANGHLERARLLMKGDAAAADSDASRGDVATSAVGAGAASDGDDAPVPSEAIYAFMPAVRAAMLLKDLQVSE